MIVKIAPHRKDGGTDFKRLKDYLTEGLAARGADLEMFSFDDLTRYITTPAVLDDLGDAVEKTVAVEIGHLHSLATAAAEMWAVAKQNPRCKDPVLHYIISWPEHERPAIADIFGAARMTLKALHLDDHQYIVAIHANTENIHAHVEVNRVHPETYLSTHLEWAHKTLHRAAREAELMYGWTHDPGLWQVVLVDGKKVIVPGGATLDPHVEAPLTTRAKDFETWSGTESLEAWCRDIPATALRKAFSDGRIKDWSDIHRILQPFGLTLSPSGGGGYKVFSAKGTDEQAVVSASKAFRFFKPRDLEATAGPYVPPSEALPPVSQLPVQAYKRDPLKRAMRREERREAREDLYRRYLDQRATARARRATVRGQVKTAQKNLEARMLAQLATQYGKRRQELLADTLLQPRDKQPLYMLMRQQYQQERRAMRSEFAKARAEFRNMIPPIPSWRAWVERQAQLGDEAAISALRGIVYRDRRGHATDGTTDDALLLASDLPPAIRPFPPISYDDPVIDARPSLTWSVTTNGRILYAFKGTNKTPPTAFVDEGPQITFGRAAVGDDALTAALLHARRKWGPTLRLDGGDRVFRERVARRSLELGFRLENRDLLEFQRTLLEITPPAGPQSPIRRLLRTTDEVLGELLHANPSATHTPADPSKSYRGGIVSITDTHVIQRVHDNLYVLHDISRMATMPKVGPAATIRYRRDGMAQHSPITKRSR